MKPDYYELLNEHTLTSAIFDKEGCINAMDICYQIGKTDGTKQVILWLENHRHLSDNIDYLIEEYINQTHQ